MCVTLSNDTDLYLVLHASAFKYLHLNRLHYTVFCILHISESPQQDEACWTAGHELSYSPIAGLGKLSPKGQIVHILGFEDHTISVAII